MRTEERLERLMSRPVHVASNVREDFVFPLIVFAAVLNCTQNYETSWRQV